MFRLSRTPSLYLYMTAVLALCFFLGSRADSQGNQQTAQPLQEYTVKTSQDTLYHPLNVPSSDKRYQLMNYFASGDAFYIDNQSYKPGPDGKLYYTVVGKNLRLTNEEDRATQRSTNMVDCNKGMYTSQLSRELLDANGEVTSKDNFQFAQPKTLTPRGPLYDMLKSACEDNGLSTKAWQY